MSERVENPNAQTWKNKQVTVLGQEYVVVRVMWDGSLVLEPSDVFGSEISMSPGAVPRE